MLENFNPATDEARRQLYVAMTRAKMNLTIHLNSNYLDNLTAENLERVDDGKIYLPPNEMAMHLTFKDVWLDYFINKQHLVSRLKSGDALTLNGDECLNSQGQSVLKFSQQFVGQIESMKERNYELKTVKVNFIVYWLKEGEEQEVKIVLPELYFERRTN
jgi:ATP-dependent DNA helicase RecQ